MVAFTKVIPDAAVSEQVAALPTRFCYAAFVTDVFSRAIVGWQVSDSLEATSPTLEFEQAFWHGSQQPRQQRKAEAQVSIKAGAVHSTTFFGGR
jgi:transposase InsO family protein